MKWKFTQLALIIFVIAISNFCYSQTDTISRKDLNGYVYNQYNLSSFKSPDKHSFPALNFSFNQHKSKTRYSIYDSPNKGFVLYDNYRQEYLPNTLNTYYPYNSINYNMEDALINGSIEYLFRLFDK